MIDIVLHYFENGDNDSLKLKDLDKNSISILNKRMTFFEWGNMVGLNINNEELAE
jgi:hypothetical protein